MTQKPSRRIERNQAKKQRQAQEAHKRSRQVDADKRRTLYANLANLLTVPTAPLPILSDHTKVPYVMAMLDGGITELQKNGKLMLPKFAPEGVLSVFSDYAGAHAQSKFETYSFMIADSGIFIKNFYKEVKKIRAKFRIPENSEISYKELKPGSQVAKCIREFARAARNIFGIVLTLIVDKSLGSIFVPEASGGLAKLHAEMANFGVSAYKPHILERAMRISYTFAYLLKLVAIPDRKVLWLPDRDSIMVNERTMGEAIRLSNMCGLTLGDHLERKVEVVGEEHIDHFKDLMAIPDLIAGATALLMTERTHDGQIGKTGFEDAMSLVDDQGLFLRNLFFCVRRGDDGNIVGEMINFALKRRLHDAVKVLI